VVPFPLQEGREGKRLLVVAVPLLPSGGKEKKKKWGFVKKKQLPDPQTKEGGRAGGLIPVVAGKREKKKGEVERPYCPGILRAGKRKKKGSTDGYYFTIQSQEGGKRRDVKIFTKTKKEGEETGPQHESI